MRDFLCLCGFLALLSGEALAENTAIIPQSRSDSGWVERQALLNQRVADIGAAAQVVFIGDSITQGWEGDGKEVWSRYYAHRKAINLGIGGDRTQHVLWRLENGNLKGVKPKAAVVMIGTNNSNSEDNSPTEILEGVTAIVHKLRIVLPGTKVLLLAIFPRGETFGIQRGKLAMINQALRRIADDKDVFWADLAPNFLTDNGTIPRALMPDFLHLSVKGYGIWARAFGWWLERADGKGVKETARHKPLKMLPYVGEYT
ncbi:MAG: GDSL family lipase [Pedosphaera sp.]|nr:GDSL family lipase [Pedosphaera sp.]